MRNPSQQFAIRQLLFLSVAGAAVISGGWAPSLHSKARAQTAQQSQSTDSAKIPDYEYDVVSVKPADPDVTQTSTRMGQGITYSADGFDAKSMRLWGLIINAYSVQQLRVMGAPAWWNTERFNLMAKVDGPTAEALQKLPPDQLKLVRQRMLQKILVDRFALTFHHETKEMTVYFLTIAKGGSKLQEHSPGHAGPNDIVDFEGNRADNRFVIRGDELIGQSVSINNFIAQLSLNMDCPIVDKTGLTGNYDFRFKYFVDYSAYASPSGGASAQMVTVQVDENGPIIAAIQKNLGLKLEQGKGSVDVVVIDHSDRPSGN
jgi:uncharacterized protein (TIGR03435 family)